MSDLAPVLGLLTAAIVIGAVLVIGTVAATRCDARPRPRHHDARMPSAPAPCRTDLTSSQRGL
jgi:hypothetical protein